MARSDTAHSTDPARLRQEYARLLGDDEQVHAVYRLSRDTVLFTDLRLILVSAVGVTGKKWEYHSIPYRDVSHFCVTATSAFAADAELHIWTTSAAGSIEYTFSDGADVYEVQALLARFVPR
ncbi:PH domain-containing protein [Streptomyces sp. NPDC059096]|uniref:PH domain-containing protein n=1 Tax=Streptomyces sp. NPDC059096 TaxID=3346727 RepID=UPI0036C82494